MRHSKDETASKICSNPLSTKSSGTLRWGARTTTNPSGSGGNWQIPFWAYPSRSEWGDRGSHIDLLFTESAFGVNSAFGNPSQKKNEISCRQVWQRCVQQPQSWHEIEIPNWDCPAKNIYKSRHVFFFFEIATTLSLFGTCQIEISCDKFHTWNSHWTHSECPSYRSCIPAHQWSQSALARWPPTRCLLKVDNQDKWFKHVMPSALIRNTHDGQDFTSACVEQTMKQAVDPPNTDRFLGKMWSVACVQGWYPPMMNAIPKV